MKQFSKDTLSQRIAWDDLDKNYIQTLISQALEEDLKGKGLKQVTHAPGDPSSEIFSNSIIGHAQLLAREDCVISGLPLIPLVLGVYGTDCSFQTDLIDGAWVHKGTTIGTLEGSAHTLLKAERIILNFIQYLSGIATLTHQYSKRLHPSKTRLLDTRKTIPVYRMLSKYAFACGGGYNHRFGLFDRVMLKDNHLAIFSSSKAMHLKSAVEQIRTRHPDLPIEVEVDHLEQIPIALEAKVDCILLDNFTIKELTKAIELIGDKACTEASGGIALNHLEDLKSLGLDFISTGAPIHQSQWIDIGLDWL